MNNIIIKVKKREIILFLIKMLLVLNTYIVFSVLFKSNDIATFRNLGKYGLFICILLLLLQYISNKIIFGPYTIIFVCFCLFQFGTPILYGLDQNYRNYYISRFNIENIIFSAKYTILCIQFFDLGVNFFNLFSNQNKKNYISKLFNKTNSICQFSKFGFYSVSLIAFPLIIYISIQGLKLGYSQIKIDAAGTNIPIFRFIKTVFIPLGLLYISYEKNERKQKRVYLLLLLYSLISLLSGARTEGLVLLLVLSYTYLNLSNKKFNVRKIIGYILSLVAIIFMLNLIASTRMGNNYLVEENNIFFDMIEEMGFNFTSIAFTRDFIPNIQDYSYGFSYISSLICLVPRSIDPTGIITSLNNNLPELWLADTLHNIYGNLFDFGVGYSVIAESYYNFGDFGYLFMIIIGVIIGKIFSKNYLDCSEFERYLQVVMLFSLVTWPRRSMLTLFKALEYNILLVLILYLVFQYIFDRKKYG